MEKIPITEQLTMCHNELSALIQRWGNESDLDIGNFISILAYEQHAMLSVAFHGAGGVEAHFDLNEDDEPEDHDI